MVHVLNAPSPAATASISIGAAIADMADRVIHLSDGRIADVITNAQRKPAKDIVW